MQFKYRLSPITLILIVFTLSGDIDFITFLYYMFGMGILYLFIPEDLRLWYFYSKKWLPRPKGAKGALAINLEQVHHIQDIKKFSTIHGGFLIEFVDLKRENSRFWVFDSEEQKDIMAEKLRRKMPLI